MTFPRRAVPVVAVLGLVAASFASPSVAHADTPPFDPNLLAYVLGAPSSVLVSAGAAQSTYLAPEAGAVDANASLIADGAADFAPVATGEMTLGAPEAGLAVLAGVVAFEATTSVAKAVGVDYTSLCAGTVPTVDQALASITGTDCGPWQEAAAIKAQPNLDQIFVANPAAVGSVACDGGSRCDTIVSTGSDAPLDPGYCVLSATGGFQYWETPVERVEGSTNWYGAANYVSGPGPVPHTTCPGDASTSDQLSFFPVAVYGYPVTSWATSQYGESNATTLPAPSRLDPSRVIRCVVTFMDNTTASADTASFQETTGMVPRPVCPGVPSTKIAASFALYLVSGSEVDLLGSVNTTDGYRAWTTNHSDCVSGGCMLDLQKSGVSCFRVGIDCSGWVADPNRDTTYTCNYDGGVLDISECYVYGPLFNATNRANGEAFGDPSTGGVVGSQTSLTPQSDIDQVESVLLTRSWVTTADYPVVDDSSKPALAAAIAAACVAELEPEPDILIIKTCSKTAIYSPGVDVAEATAHDLSAIGAGQPSVLHYETRAQKAAGLPPVAGVAPGWYGDPSTNCSGDVYAAPDPRATNCDEYPFYATVEGGTGASLVNISATDNGTQGRQLGQFYGACGLAGSPTASDSNKFLVVPNPGSPSVGICGVG